MIRLILTVSVMLLVGCGGSDAQTRATTPSSAAVTAVAPGAAKVGDKTTCPVSHETFVVTNDSPHEEVNGKTYYFCCQECAHMFHANPAKYVN